MVDPEDSEAGREGTEEAVATIRGDGHRKKKCIVEVHPQDGKGANEVGGQTKNQWRETHLWRLSRTVALTKPQLVHPTIQQTTNFQRTHKEILLQQ